MSTLCDSRFRIGGAFAIVALAALCGCKEEGEKAGHSRGGPEPALTVESTFGPETSPVEVDMSQGWCGGHGVPESVCTRCNPSLIPRFKAANDWCRGHDLPETQCELCNPGVQAKWRALEPRVSGAGSAEDKDSGTGETIRLESDRRLLTGSNNSQ